MSEFDVGSSANKIMNDLAICNPNNLRKQADNMQALCRELKRHELDLEDLLLRAK